MKVILYTNAENFYSDLCESIRSFYPDAEIDLTQSKNDATVSVFGIIHELTKGECFISSAKLYINGEEAASAKEEQRPEGSSPLYIKKISKKVSKLSIFKLLKQFTKVDLPWGALTGIRPTKLVYDNAHLGKEGIEALLAKTYNVHHDKISLLFDIVKAQEPFIGHQEQDVDVYTGIPFCKTRCIYCSFATTDAIKGRKLIPGYLDCLYKEIEYTAKLIKEYNKTLRCVYIGGGTPTALNNEDFAAFIDLCAACFGSAEEFTVEAGRPDTLNEYKLQKMKAVGVNRISINPQSMNESTLDAIGRSHTPGEIIDMVKLAKQYQFDVLNMDIIAGLPGEDIEMFKYTLDEVIKLDPENITIHTLSLKKGSVLANEPDKYNLQDATVVSQMVDTARAALQAKGYEPYYLYRQKYQTGNLENVGYAKAGTACIYNIDIMEETTDIIALGAGAISKRVYSKENRIERFANSKGIMDYCSRIDEMLAKKAALFATYK